MHDLAGLVSDICCGTKAANTGTKIHCLDGVEGVKEIVAEAVISNVRLREGSIVDGILFRCNSINKVKLRQTAGPYAACHNRVDRGMP